MYQLKRSLCHAGLLFTALFLNLAKGAANDTSIELLDLNQSDSTSSCIIGLLDKYDKISLTTILKNFELRNGGATIELKLYIADESTKNHKTDGLLILYRFPFNCSGRMRYDTSCKVVSSGHYEITFHILVAYTMSKGLMQTLIYNKENTFESNKIQLPTVYDPSQINFYVNNGMLSPKQCEIELTKSRNTTLCCGEDAPTSTLAAIYHNDMMVAQSEKCVSYTDQTLESFHIFRFECKICETTVHEIACHVYDYLSVQEDSTKKNTILPGPEDISDHTNGMDKLVLIFITLAICIIVVVTAQCFYIKRYVAIKESGLFCCHKKNNKDSMIELSLQKEKSGLFCCHKKNNKDSISKIELSWQKEKSGLFCCHKKNNKDSISKIELSWQKEKLIGDPWVKKELFVESAFIEDISPETKEHFSDKWNDKESCEQSIHISTETKETMSPGDKNDQEISTEVEIITNPTAKTNLKLKECNKYVTFTEKPECSASNYGYVISIAEERRERQSGFENNTISKDTDVDQYEKPISSQNNPDALKTTIFHLLLSVSEDEVTTDFEKETLSKLRDCLAPNTEKNSDPSSKTKIFFYDTLEKCEKDFLKYFLDKDVDLHSYDLKGQMKRFFSKKQALKQRQTEVTF